eukprot:gene10934-3640_t
MSWEIAADFLFPPLVLAYEVVMLMVHGASDNKKMYIKGYCLHVLCYLGTVLLNFELKRLYVSGIYLLLYTSKSIFFYKKPRNMTKDRSFEVFKKKLFYILIGSSIIYGSLFLFINEQIRIGSFFVLPGIFWHLWINLQLILETKCHRHFELENLTGKIKKMENMMEWINKRENILERDEDDDTLNALVCVYNILIFAILIIVYFMKDNNYIPKVWCQFYVILLIFTASIYAYYAGKINKENQNKEKNF